MGFRPDVQVISGGNNVYTGQVSNFTQRVTPDGGMLVNEFQGKFAEAWRTGLMFHDMSVIGGIVITGPQAAAGVVCPQLFVPLGGAHNIWLEVVSLDLTWLSGNNVPGAFGWYSRGPSSGAATGGLIATLVTPATITNMYTMATAVTSVGNIHQSYMGQSTFTTSAPTLFRASSMSMFTGISTTAVAPFQLREVYDGMLNVPNGWFVSFNTIQANGTATFIPGLTVVEHYTT